MPPGCHNALWMRGLLLALHLTLLLSVPLLSILEGPLSCACASSFEVPELAFHMVAPNAPPAVETDSLAQIQLRKPPNV